MFNLRILSVLERLEGKKSSFWNVPRRTAEFLYNTVVERGGRNILEIGTSNGYSGIFLAEAARKLDGFLYTVESHAERFSLAQRHFEEAGVSDRVYQILGHAPEVFHEFPEFFRGAGFFDFVFVDATKMEYIRYVEAITPFLKRGATMVFDNCTSHEQTLAPFFEFIQKEARFRTTFLPFDNGLLLVELLSSS